MVGKAWKEDTSWKFRACVERYHKGHYLLRSWSRVLLEKLTSFQRVKKYPAFYGTRRFITTVTNARHLSLSWARSTPTSHFLKIHLNIILPSTPGSPKCCRSFRFSHQNPVYASPLPHTRYMSRSSHSSRFCHANNIGWGVHIIKLHSPLTSPLLGPNILNALFSNTLSLRSSPQRERPSFTPIHHNGHYRNKRRWRGLDSSG